MGRLVNLRLPRGFIRCLSNSVSPGNSTSNELHVLRPQSYLSLLSKAALESLQESTFGRNPAQVCSPACTIASTYRLGLHFEWQHSLIACLDFLGAVVKLPSKPFIKSCREPLLLKKEFVAAMALTDKQVQVVIILERTGASLSLVGITFIFVAYWMFRRLRTIPNLFILFASIANVGASIACIIGYDGILSGEESALCQAQAFLLEMFVCHAPLLFFLLLNTFLQVHAIRPLVVSRHGRQRFPRLLFRRKSYLFPTISLVVLPRLLWRTIRTRHCHARGAARRQTNLRRCHGTLSDVDEVISLTS